MKKILLTTLLCFISYPAFSIQINFMSDSPVRYYTDQDWKLANAATDEALNNSPIGKKITWDNPKSHNHGYTQAIENFNKNNLTCRKIKIFNYAAERSDQYTFTFCKYPNGWKIPGDGFN
jgi:surface antigen